GGLLEQHLGQVDGLRTVDERLVRLEQQRHPSAAETFDQVELPQGTVQVEAARDETADELVQSSGRARTRQRRTAYVQRDVEALVVEPHRRAERARHRTRHLPVTRHQV